MSGEKTDEETFREPADAEMNSAATTDVRIAPAITVPVKTNTGTAAAAPTAETAGMLIQSAKTAVIVPPTVIADAEMPHIIPQITRPEAVPVNPVRTMST